MFTQQEQIMRRVHAAFVATEKSVHAAAKDVAVCQSTMFVAADEIGAPLGVGLKAMSKVSEANALITRARQLMIEAHPIMKRVPQILGYDGPGDLGYGHGESTPALSMEDKRAQQPTLQMVA